MNLGGLVNVATGLMGLGGSGRASRAQEAAMREAARVNGLRANGLERLLRLAGQYDPATEDQAGLDYAGRLTEDTLNRSLKGINQEFRNAGGNPTGDTLFRAKVQGTTDRVADPLRAKAADLATTRTARKAQMLSGALGSGGDIAGSYLQQSQMYESDPTAAMALLAGGIESLLPRSSQAGQGGMQSMVQRPRQPEEGRVSLPSMGGQRFDTSGGRNDPIRLRKVGRG